MSVCLCVLQTLFIILSIVSSPGVNLFDWGSFMLFRTSQGFLVMIIFPVFFSLFFRVMLVFPVLQHFLRNPQCRLFFSIALLNNKCSQSQGRRGCQKQTIWIVVAEHSIPGSPVPNTKCLLLLKDLQSHKTQMCKG